MENPKISFSDIVEISGEGESRTYKTVYGLVLASSVEVILCEFEPEAVPYASHSEVREARQPKTQTDTSIFMHQLPA